MVEAIAKANDWSTRIARDANTPLFLLPFLLIQKELCKLVVYSNREDVLWVCSYPQMDDIFQLDKNGDDWFVAGSPANPALILQLLEDHFRMVKKYNEEPTDLLEFFLRHGVSHVYP